MVEEQNIKKQIAAMEGWSIQSKRNVDSQMYKETKQLLRDVDRQGRRLEWRGGKNGLKHLPDFLGEVKSLKKKITEARTAAEQALTSIVHLEKCTSKEGKRAEVVAAISRKEGGYKKEAGKNIYILIQVLKEARAIAEREPWRNLAVLLRPENITFLGKYFSGRYYRSSAFSLEEMRVFAGSGLLKGISLRGMDLKDVDFTLANLEGADLLGVNFERAILVSTNFKKANLFGANFERADLTATNFSEARLINANFSKAHIGNTSFEGADLQGADFQDAQGLTKYTFKYAKNIDKAKNVPPLR